VKNWDEEERKIWDDGKYSKRFKSREGSKCCGSYGHYYDRSHNYHGGHIQTYIDCECGVGYQTYLIQHGRNGCGYRYRFISHTFSYCQCSYNIKEE
jgi:hypothetical protein